VGVEASIRSCEEGGSIQEDIPTGGAGRDASLLSECQTESKYDKP
jgi:hypothetical protein